MTDINVQFKELNFKFNEYIQDQKHIKTEKQLLTSILIVLSLCIGLLYYASYLYANSILLVFNACEMIFIWFGLFLLIPKHYKYKTVNYESYIIDIQNLVIKTLHISKQELLDEINLYPSKNKKIHSFYLDANLFQTICDNLRELVRQKELLEEQKIEEAKRQKKLEEQRQLEESAKLNTQDLLEESSHKQSDQSTIDKPKIQQISQSIQPKQIAWTCKKCGKLNRNIEDFCEYCGNKHVVIKF